MIPITGNCDRRHECPSGADFLPRSTRERAWRHTSRAHQVATRDFSRESRTHLIRAREAGQASVGQAEDQEADLLILGYHQNGRISKTVLGSTVEYVAQHPGCRVLVEVLPASKKPEQ